MKTAELIAAGPSPYTRYERSGGHFVFVVDGPHKRKLALLRTPTAAVGYVFYPDNGQYWAHAHGTPDTVSRWLAQEEARHWGNEDPNRPRPGALHCNFWNLDLLNKTINTPGYLTARVHSGLLEPIGPL